jgi:hypothetical protein
MLTSGVACVSLVAAAVAADSGPHTPQRVVHVDPLDDFELLHPELGGLPAGERLRRLEAAAGGNLPAFVARQRQNLARHEAQRQARGLEARVPLSKTPTPQLLVPPTATGRLIVKFRDGVRARSGPEGSVVSAAGSDLAGIRDLQQRLKLSFRQLLPQGQGQLAALEARAAAHSGKEQPDLAGILCIEGLHDHDRLLNVARALNELPEVEYVEIEVPVKPIGATTPDPDRLRRQSRDRFQILTDGEVVERANLEFGLRRSSVATLGVPVAAPQGAIQVELPLEGMPVTLALAPHSIRSEAFRLLEVRPDGSVVDLAPGPEPTVRGHVLGMPGSSVAGAIGPSGLTLSVELPGGTPFWVEPLASRLRGAAAGQHVIYSSADVIAPQGFCGTPDEPAGPPRVPASVPQGGCSGLAYAELALDVDFDWIQRFQSLDEAVLYAAAVINVINIQYERDVDISHVLSAMVLRTSAAANAPYTTNNPFVLHDQFMLEWNTNFTSVQRDLAHLLTGRDLAGGIIGYGPGLVCWSEAGEPFHYSLAQLFGSFDCQTDLSAHEIGHNWGAGHCNCLDTMQSGVLSCPNLFMAPSVSSILTWKGFIDNTCLDCFPGSAPPGCGSDSAQSCLVAHGTPHCNDLICCEMVCTIDPLCCEAAWDDACVMQAAAVCVGCGDPAAGHCLGRNGTPGCDNPVCCNTVALAQYTIPHPIVTHPITGASCTSYWGDKCAVLGWVTCGGTLGLEPTPDLEPFQAYKSLETKPEFGVLSCELLAGGFCELCGSFISGFLGADCYGGEGFDLPGVWALGDELVGLGVGTQNLSRGKSIRIGVVEDAAYFQHEDLTHVTFEPGQTIFLSEDVTTPSHGTATLGIIAAHENGFGMTGMAPDAEPYFFPTFSLEEGGRLAAAITSAIMTFGPGDVLSFSIGPDFGPDCFDCALGSQILTGTATTYALIRLASDVGITSCIAAGNSSCNLDTTEEFGDDSGAFIVTAVTPGVPFCRLPFSNHSEQDADGGIADYSAWGMLVATLGYGDLFGPIDDPNRWYTTTFGGTSAATPMIAAICADMQGLLKQFYGIPLTPDQLGSIVVGYCQCLICDPMFRPGTLDPPDGNGACDPDAIPWDNEEEPDKNNVALTCAAFNWAVELLTSEWYNDSVLLDELWVLRGQHIVGNINSVKESDNNYLVIESEYTPQSPGGSDPLDPPYLGFGQVADVVVAAHADVPDVNLLQVGVESHVSNGVGLLFTDLWDWSQNRWIFNGFAVLFPFDNGYLFPTAVTGDFIRPSDDLALIRVQAITLGGPDGGGIGNPGATAYRVFHDLIFLGTSAEFGDVFPP